MEKIDLLIQNAQVFNSYLKRFQQANVWVKENRFFYIDRSGLAPVEARQTLDAQGRHMIPGLIDIHLHIESSMLTPPAFAHRLAQCGVTTAITEPHEMANVNGMQGVLDMIEAGQGNAVDLFYGIPSCVPSTNADLEGNGGAISCEDMIRLWKHPSVVCVGEIMNYSHVIQDNDLEITKFLSWLSEHDPKFPIEGHCPALLDLELAKFLYLGINADHTEHNLEELAQRAENGMFLEIQQKMLQRDVLDYLMEHELYERFCFVTDDVMADTLYRQGHLNVIAAQAIGLGMRPEDVIYCATYTPSRRMQLFDRGAIAPGKLADFVLLDDLRSFQIDSVYKRGTRVDGKPLPIQSAFPVGYYDSICLSPLAPGQFHIPIDRPDGDVTVRVMELHNNSTRTTAVTRTLPVRSGLLQWEGSGLALAAVWNRYGTGEVGFGLVDGCCHKSGAVATTYSHDSHNLLVVGHDLEDLCAAANRVIDLRGGFVVSNHGKIQAELALPVGGILCGGSAKDAGIGLEQVRRAMTAQGYDHYNPIMSLATLALPVSPALKLTDKGLVDVKAAAVVPLIADL